MRGDRPVLAVVVITRNEALHIDACLRSISQVVKVFPETPVVVIDSDSIDGTVAIAASHPVTVYRYRAPRLTAAAGRRIGFEKVDAEYVLFLDGDCTVEVDWVQSAVAVMDKLSGVAVVYGKRRAVFEEVPKGFRVANAAIEESPLGGNALYRSKALREVGGFNPFIIGEEEAELLGRIEAAGYGAIRKSGVMITHYSRARDNLQELGRRHRLGHTKGPGQVLRVSISNGLFAHQARRFSRLLQAFGFLWCGVILAIVGVISGEPAFPLAWVAAATLGFIGLWFRQRRLRTAVYTVLEWVIVSIGIVVGFVESPKKLKTFQVQIDLLSQPQKSTSDPVSSFSSSSKDRLPEHI